MAGNFLYKAVIEGVDKTGGAFKSIEGNLKSVTKLAGAFTGLLAAGGIASAGKQAIDAADKIQKLGIRLGASTEALSEYRHVAELSGVTFETFTMGLQRSTRRIAEAAAGSGEAKKALKELGISAVELNKLRPEQQFEILAEALNSVDVEADKVRLAMKLFDSEGVALLQTMTEGAEGIRGMRDEARALGLTLSQEQADGAAAANDALTRLGAQYNGLIQQLAVALAPTLEIVVGMFSDAMPTAISWTSRAVSAMKSVIFTYLDWLLSLAEGTNAVIDSLAGFLGIETNMAQPIKNIRAIIQDMAKDYADAASGVSAGNVEIKKSAEALAVPIVELGEVEIPKVVDALEEIEVTSRRGAKGIYALTKEQQTLLDQYLPLEKAQREAAYAFDELVKLKASGAITAEQYATAVENVGRQLTGLGDNKPASDDLADPFAKAAGAITKAFGDTFDELSVGVKGFVNATVNTLAGLFDSGQGLGGLWDGQGTEGADLLTMGLSAVGQQAGGSALGTVASWASMGATIGSVIPGIGTAIGAAVGAIAGGLSELLKDEGDPRVRVTTGGTAGSFGSRTYLRDTAFGAVGLDLADGGVTNAFLGELLDSIQDFDDSIANLLNPQQIAAVSASLAGSSTYLNGDVDSETILKDRLDKIVTAIELPLADLVVGLDDLEDSLAAFGAVLSLQEFAGLDLITEWQQVAEDAARTSFQVMRDQGRNIRVAARHFDGSFESLMALSQETEAYFQMQMRLLSQIQAAGEQVSAIIGGSIERIAMSQMTQQEQRQYLLGQRADLMAELRTAQSPEEITRLVAEIERITSTVFDSLNEGGQRRTAEGFMEYLESVQEIAQARLDRAASEAERDAQRTQAQISEFLSAGTAVVEGIGSTIPGFQGAADRMGYAADTMLTAASTPITITADYGQGEIAVAS